MSAVLNSLFAAALIVPMTTTTDTPLPDSLVALFHAYGPYAETMYLPVDTGSEIHGRFSFENHASNPNGVEVLWTYKSGSASPNSTVQFIATSFRPTALCRWAGESDVLYVAGWSERLARVVLEKWVFERYALSEELLLDGSGPQTELMVPMVRRSLLFQCDRLQPLSSIACNYKANELWLLEEPVTSGRALWAYDLEATSCDDLTALSVGAAQVDRATYPILADMTTIYVGEHPTVGGIVYIHEMRSWESPTRYQEPYPMILIRDPDVDGVPDQLSVETYHDLYTAYPAQDWDHRYK